MSYETVWTFETARTRTTLSIAVDPYYDYDGDDEDGSTQDALDAGDLVAFDSVVRVEVDGRVIAEDHLGGSVYAANDVEAFWTEHRSADPMNRNCSVMRTARGANVCICHYFPGMVAEAVKAARAALSDLPRLRAA